MVAATGDRGCDVEVVGVAAQRASEEGGTIAARAKDRDVVGVTAAVAVVVAAVAGSVAGYLIGRKQQLERGRRRRERRQHA